MDISPIPGRDRVLDAVSHSSPYEYSVLEVLSADGWFPMSRIPAPRCYGSGIKPAPAASPKMILLRPTCGLPTSDLAPATELHGSTSTSMTNSTSCAPGSDAVVRSRRTGKAGYDALQDLKMTTLPSCMPLPATRNRKIQRRYWQISNLDE